MDTVITQHIEIIRSTSPKNKGIIYMITSPIGKSYIGQTKLAFERRKRYHKNRFDDFVRNIGNNKSFMTFLYKDMQEHGFDNFIWKILVQDVDHTNLNNIEDNMIEQYKTMIPNGYNQRTNKKCSVILKHIMSEKCQEKRVTNFYKMRNDIYVSYTNGLPQYISFINTNNCKGYKIINHPRCKNKQFALKNPTDEQLNELKNKTLIFLQELESNNNVFKSKQQLKLETGIPKGISKIHDNCYLVQFTVKGKKYTKTLNNLGEAVLWMENKKKEVKSINLFKENCSETKESVGDFA